MIKKDDPSGNKYTVKIDDYEDGKSAMISVSKNTFGIVDPIQHGSKDDSKKYDDAELAALKRLIQGRIAWCNLRKAWKYRHRDYTGATSC